MRTRTRIAAGLVPGLLLTACAGGGDGGEGAVTPDAASSAAPATSATATLAGSSAPGAPAPSGAPAAAPPKRGTVPPPWLGTRVLEEDAQGYGIARPTPPVLRKRRFTLPDTVPMLPGTGFRSAVSAPAPADVIARSTWVRGCPVAADDLARVRLTFWGFDDARHTGELLVNRSVVRDVVRVFRALYRARFPLEEMRITTRPELDAPPTGDGNNTGAFVCRPSVGQTSFSEHAYGLAIDLNPFQNPYVKGSRVIPELASAYLDRDRRAPGMIRPGDAVTRAFARIGWGWGGAWRSLKDYQHFSAHDR